MKKDELRILAIRRIDYLLSIYKDIDLPFDEFNCEFYLEVKKK